MKGKLKKLDKDKLPVYEIVIDDNDNTGISLISLVDEPAIVMKGMLFSEEKTMMSFKEVDEDKQEIVGPALIPNMKIYREDEKYGQYYVVFSKETIEKMVEKFNKYGSNRRINIDHSNQMVDGFIMEDWIVEDPVYDKSRKYGFEVPVGTYMIKVKIEDKDFWMSEVKENGKFGFSIEGLLGQQLVSLSKQEDEVSIDDLTLEDLIQIFAEIGERGGVKESKKAPKSDTPNKNPKGEGTAKGDAGTTRGAKVSERVEKILKKKADDFNERYKEKLGYGVDVGMLKSVYQRGVGAFNVSHSPKVSSAEQWALARVNAFLYIVKNGRPENPKYVDDNDLLPKKHKKRSEMSFAEISEGKIICEDCDWSWNIEDGGKDPYVCHKCNGKGVLEIKLESYADYPDGVKNNAKKVLEYTEKNGWGSCGTPVGKVRANQLAKGEAISLETIKRMYSYLSRHEVDLETSTSFSDGCGYMMYMSWGGKAALGWSRNKLRELGELKEDEQQFKNWRNTANSSNVDKMKYNDETKELVIKFNDGSYYTYFDIDFEQFMAVVEGDGTCVTEGQNEYGSWSIGKNPSVGAAVWEWLINAIPEPRFVRGGSLR